MNERSHQQAEELTPHIIFISDHDPNKEEEYLHSMIRHDEYFLENKTKYK